MEWDQETGLREEGQQAAQKKVKSQDLIFAFFSSEFSLILPRWPEIWLGRRAHTCNPALLRWREEGHKFKVSLHTFTMTTEYPICSPQWVLNKPKKGSRETGRKTGEGIAADKVEYVAVYLQFGSLNKRMSTGPKPWRPKTSNQHCMLPRLQKGHMATVRQSQPFSEENLRNYSVSQEQRQERAWDWPPAPTSAPTTSSQTNPFFASSQLPGTWRGTLGPHPGNSHGNALRLNDPVTRIRAHQLSC